MAPGRVASMATQHSAAPAPWLRNKLTTSVRPCTIMRALRPMQILPYCACLLVGIASQPAAAQIQKCEIDGKVIYQQGRCPSTAEVARPTAKQLNAQRQNQARQAGNPRPPLPGSSPSGSAIQAPRAMPTQTTPAYRCDNRKHCSQMTSCAEAKYFLANCPGVKMDGDHDGIPCEDQWCSN